MTYQNIKHSNIYVYNATYQLIFDLKLVQSDTMSHTKLSLSTKGSKRNFVKENAKGQISKHFNQQFTPGKFTTHHPSRCYHIVDSHPIHLQRENPIDGKESVRICTQEYIRDLLVPATSNLYPAIWHVSEINRIKTKSLRLTNDEKQANIRNVEEMNKILKDASEERKMLIMKWNE